MNNVIKNIINDLKDKKSQNLEEFIENNLNNKKVMIYGAGAFGREIFNILTTNNINITGFLDSNKSGTLLDTPIYNPKEYKDKNIVIVLAIVLYKHTRDEILEYLKSLGFKNIIDAQEIRARYVYIQDSKEHSYEYFFNQLDEILKPLEFLSDEESKEAYISTISSHISRDYSNTYESNEIEQYFIKDIDFKKDFSRFVDCGAYNGDTFNMLLKHEPNLKEYIGFEPNRDSFLDLKKSISKHQIESTIFPLGVSNCVKSVNFNYNMGSSCIDENAEERIYCTGLDDVLIHKKPTFIKMDIEGEEINALNGAKELISYAKPDLAICVYHYIDHFWKIPNLINNWNLGYKFYLRTHSSACMETVLYAFMEEK